MKSKTIKHKTAFKLTVYKTTDYSIFQKIKDVGNRDIYEAHVRAIVKNTKKKDIHHLSPIIVNEDMLVIDGQHTLESREILNAEAYYIIVPGLTIKDARLKNSTVKAWTLRDFIKSNCDENNKHYIELRNYMKKYSLSATHSAAYLAGEDLPSGGAVICDIIKNDKFKVLDRKGAEIKGKRISAIRELKKGDENIIPKNIARSRDFLKGLEVFMKSGANFDTLIKRLVAFPKDFQKKSSYMEYAVQLEEIYNFHVAEKNRVSIISVVTNRTFIPNKKTSTASKKKKSKA